MTHCVWLNIVCTGKHVFVIAVTDLRLIGQQKQLKDILIFTSASIRVIPSLRPRA